MGDQTCTTLFIYTEICDIRLKYNSLIVLQRFRVLDHSTVGHYKKIIFSCFSKRSQLRKNQTNMYLFIHTLHDLAPVVFVLYKVSFVSDIVNS
jgi:hypothetical protein